MTSVTRVDSAAARMDISSLPLDVFSTHILSSEFLPETADLGRLRAVNKGMRDAVDATGREIKKLSDREAVDLDAPESEEYIGRFTATCPLPTMSARAAAFRCALRLSYRRTRLGTPTASRFGSNAPWRKAYHISLVVPGASEIMYATTPPMSIASVTVYFLP